MRVRLMPRIWLLALLLGFLASTPVAAIEYQGRVVGVIDGDSIKVMHHGKAEQIRLLGIDCPEKRQPFGTRAKEYTSGLAFGQEVTVYGDKRDRYRRTLAEVLLPDGRSLNQELVRAGMAWWFRKYSKDLRLGELEREAREEKRGLWSEAHPVPPWEWRKIQSRSGHYPSP
ncbi:nuclease [Nitrospirales bacterium NOB]|nr:nuclease [Nitrospira sp. NTP2]MDL1888435.1 nuclease [Nitrospirales bacterium NOB]